MRQSIQDLTRLTMPEWDKFKEHFRTLPPGYRLGDIAYQRRLVDQQVAEFRALLVGRCRELEAIHDERRAKGL
jgi:hypothetical protein